MNRRAIQLHRSHRDRGMIFVAALGIIIVLTGLVLVFARSMTTDAIAAGNRRSQAQADAIEQGAEQWVLAQCEAYQTDAMTITQVPAEAVQVGSGYFWILTPDPQSDSTYTFGITDEASKLNINTAPAGELMNLPCDLQQNIADAITDWRNPASSATSDGAETSYYESLTEPYECKNGSYETVEELLLVDGVTPQLLWGYDLNRDGVVSDAERAASQGAATVFTGGDSGYDDRGIYAYLTCYTTGAVTNGRASQAGLVNVNTASEEVLMALGLSQGDADALIDARQGNDYTNTSWVQGTISASSYQEIARLITGTSNQYSADIVAVSGDGRAFKRVRIVVDVSAIPAKIIYHKDLTSYGWPLPDTIRQQLLAGQPIQSGVLGQNMTSSGTLGQP